MANVTPPTTLLQHTIALCSSGYSIHTNKNRLPRYNFIITSRYNYYILVALLRSTTILYSSLILGCISSLLLRLSTLPVILNNNTGWAIWVTVKKYSLGLTLNLLHETNTADCISKLLQFISMNDIFITAVVFLRVTALTTLLLHQSFCCYWWLIHPASWQCVPPGRGRCRCCGPQKPWSPRWCTGWCAGWCCGTEHTRQHG